MYEVSEGAENIILNWYGDADISILIDARIREMEGYVADHTFLLAGVVDGKFPDEDGQYRVLVTPAIDVAQRALPIDYFLDKTKQLRNFLPVLLEKVCLQLPALQEQRTNEIELKKRLTILLADNISSTDRGDSVKLVCSELNNFDFNLQNLRKRIAELDLNVSQKDIFDEIKSLLQSDSLVENIKILTPYNITQTHWLTLEVKIHKRIYLARYHYTVEITAHDPKGGGSILPTNYEILSSTLERKIKELDSTASVICKCYESPYLPRQASDDGNACGVIVVEDLTKRIAGGALLQQQPHPFGARAIRQEHINLVMRQFKEADPTRIGFLARRQAPIIVEQKTKKTISDIPPSMPLSFPVMTKAATSSSIENPVASISSAGEGVYDHILGKIVSYKALDLATNRLANYLRNCFPAPTKETKRIAAFMPQSLEYWQCFYALHKADMAIMPISPYSDAPAERLASFLHGGSITAIISLSRFKKHPFFYTSQAQALEKNKAIIFMDEEQVAIENADSKAPKEMHTLEDLAYIINTSGSSGNPKQVLVPHVGIPLCTQGHIDALNIRDTDTIAGFADNMFDAHIVEMDAAKKTGAKFLIVPEEYRRDLTKLAKFYQSHRITVGVFVTSMLRQYKKANFPDLRVVICTGGKIDESIISEWGDKVILIDGYGPAENTIATWLKIFHVKVDSDKLQYTVEMKMIPGTECFILQNEPDVPGEPLKLVKMGEEGRLFIAGKGLAIGYSNAKLSNERFQFIQHPFDNTRTLRVYDTQDLAKQNPDGSLDITGRLDRQVKIYGKLLCPEEIEILLAKIYEKYFAKVQVDAKINENGHPELVFYYELRPGQKCPPLREMAEKVRQTLGETFVPTAWVDIGTFPTLDSGKIDTKKVPTLSGLIVDRIHGENTTLPQTDLENDVAQLFLRVLSPPEKNFILYRGDNFFELGGKSLQATLLLQMLRNHYDLRLTYDEFKMHPTVEQLARLINRVSNKTQLVPIIPIHEEHAAIDNAPVIFFPSLMGDIEKDLEKFRRQWPYPRNIYGIKSRGYTDPTDMDNDLITIAYDFYRAVKDRFHLGPMTLAGWSLGGIYAALVQLFFILDGNENVNVMMIDSESPSIFQSYSSLEYAKYLRDLFERKLMPLINTRDLPLKLEVLASLAKEKQVNQLFNALETTITDSDPLKKYKRGLLATVRGSLLGVLKVRFTHPINNINLIVASETKAKHASDRLGWPTIVEIKPNSLMITANHDSIMLEEPNAKRIAEHLQQLCIEHENHCRSNRLANELSAKSNPDIDIDELQYYIALNGCRNNNQDITFPLFAEVQKDFLGRLQKKFMIIIGPVATGKTMFLSNLAEYIRKNRTFFGNRVVLYIPCASYEDPHINLLEKHLHRLGYNDSQIAWMKQHLKFIIIIDGREEIVGRARYMNIYMTNMFDKLDAQVIMGIRDTFFLDPNLDKTIFYPLVNGRPQMAGIVEFYLSPFKPEQIKEYIETFLSNPPEDFKEIIEDKLMFYLSAKYPLDTEEQLKDKVKVQLAEWLKSETYLKTKDALPGVSNVITTPFLMRVFMEICIDLAFENEDKPLEERIEETEAHALDLFVEGLWDRQAFRLMSNPEIELPPRDIRIEFEDYCLKLAIRMKLADVTQVTYKAGPDSLWEEFFNSRPEVILKRSGAPLKRFTQGPTVMATPMQLRRQRYNVERVESGEIIGWLNNIFIEHLVSRAVLKNHPDIMNSAALSQRYRPQEIPKLVPSSLSTPPITTFFAKAASNTLKATAAPTPKALPQPFVEENDSDFLEAQRMSMEPTTIAMSSVRPTPVQCETGTTTPSQSGAEIEDPGILGAMRVGRPPLK